MTLSHQLSNIRKRSNSDLSQIGSQQGILRAMKGSFIPNTSTGHILVINKYYQLVIMTRYMLLLAEII